MYLCLWTLHHHDQETSDVEDVIMADHVPEPHSHLSQRKTSVKEEEAIQEHKKSNSSNLDSLVGENMTKVLERLNTNSMITRQSAEAESFINLTRFESKSFFIENDLGRNSTNMDAKDFDENFNNSVGGHATGATEVTTSVEQKNTVGLPSPKPTEASQFLRGRRHSFPIRPEPNPSC